MPQGACWTCWPERGDDDDDGGDDDVVAREGVCPEPDTLALGSSDSGALAVDDCRRPGGTFQDTWVLDVPADTTLRIGVSSTAFDAFLILKDSLGAWITSDDDGGGGVDSLVEPRVTAGCYRIRASALFAGATGSYTVTVRFPGTRPPPSAGASGEPKAGGGAASPSPAGLLSRPPKRSVGLLVR